MLKKESARKLLAVHFLWAIELFVGKGSFCLFGLVSFDERVKAGGTTEEIHNVKLFNVSKFEKKNKLIGFLYNCRFNISLIYKNWLQIRLDQVNIVFCAVESKDWKNVTVAIKMFLLSARLRLWWGCFSTAQSFILIAVSTSIKFNFI